MDDQGPPFERGEVTVRSIYCFGLDAAITGRPPSASLNNGGAGVSDDHGGVAGGADGGGGGGIIAGGTSRPFYVTITLGGVTAKTSPRSGFSPSFTEVFPLGCDCPIRGAFLTVAVVDRYKEQWALTEMGGSRAWHMARVGQEEIEGAYLMRIAGK